MRSQHRNRPGPLVLRLVLAAVSLAAGTLCSWTATAGEPDPSCVPSPEICDGIDNDCDGVIDDGNPGGAIPCPTGLLGACGEGTWTCVDGAMVCVPEILPGHDAEVCDEVDNDCDGLVDEGFDVGAFCTIGVGACTVEGWKVCSSTGFTLCNAVASDPVEEKCNGLDDDCDGEIDNGNPEGGQDCALQGIGVCAVGATLCDHGVMLCVATKHPGELPEKCNGLDDDCDGLVDDGEPDTGLPCLSGIAGACSTGLTICVNGLVICKSIVAPGELAEVCGDAEDSDCDGQTDNGCGAGGSGGATGTGPSTGGAPSDECEVDADCDEGLVCDAGKCVLPEGGDGLDGNQLGAQCACRSSRIGGAPIDVLSCVGAAATVIAAGARARSKNKRR